ncbi:MAG: [LysW]-aminoadipate kinase [Thermomicrobia bacterium]|nr:[LysW]-aminoadipate kinase [Thermomicrobia bacterium]
MLVIKLGGSRGIDTEAFISDLAAVVRGGEQVVFVHGGNKELDDLCERLGIPVRQVTSATGQVSRFTDAETMDAFLMAYAGRINKRLVEKLQALGVNAVGLTAMDGHIASGRRKSAIRIIEEGKPKMLHGDFAGSIETIDPMLPRLLVANGYLPVLTPPAISIDGEAINVDGDKLAMELAVALGADALLIFSNTPGLLADVNDEASLVRHIPFTGAMDEAALSMAQGRMKKKVLSAFSALKGGVGQVVFADARVVEPVHRALRGEGTVIAPRAAGTEGAGG